MIIARRSGGKAVVRIVRLSGSTMAPPSPWTVRATISSDAFGASAQAADAIVKSACPKLKMRRRPKRSPRAAAVMIPAAKAMPYAFRVHCRLDRLTWEVALHPRQRSDHDDRVERDHEVGRRGEHEHPAETSLALCVSGCARK